MAANLLFDRLANGDIEQGAFEEDFEDEDNDNLFNWSTLTWSLHNNYLFISIFIFNL